MVKQKKQFEETVLFNRVIDYEEDVYWETVKFADEAKRSSILKAQTNTKKYRRAEG